MTDEVMNSGVPLRPQQVTADKEEQLFNSLFYTETPEKAGGEDRRGSQILD